MNMNAIEITARLIQGSHNIDRMRKEVHEVIATVVGLLKILSDESAENFDERFISNSYDWRITRVLNRDNDSVTVHCFSNESDVAAVHYSSNYNHSEIKYFSVNNASNIQIAYTGLPVFIAGMLEKFPKLAEKLAFLIDASNVKFP